MDQIMDRTIVIGYDPERGGRDALCLGRDLAQALGARPVVLTTLTWPEYLASAPETQAQIDAEMKPHLAVVRDLLGPDAATRAVARRSGSQALVECAEEVGAGLVVVGSSHRSAIGRTLLGSTGESLMQGSPTAVVVAPSGYADGDHDLRAIAVAYDGSPEAASSLDAAIAIARRSGATVTIVTVADYINYGYSTAWSVFTTGEIEDAERKEKRRILEAGLEEVPDDVDTEGRLLVGAAGPELAGISGGFDLVVTGSRGYGPLRRTILGSTSRQLVSGAACPVLVLPRDAGSDPLGLSGDAGA